MLDRQNVFDQPVKNNLITYDSIWNIATGQGDDCTTDCLLDYNYYKDYYKMIAIDLSKQQALDANPTTNYFYRKSRLRSRCNNVFHYWISKRNRFKFFPRNCKSILILFFV